jgi:hypothetical protein
MKNPESRNHPTTTNQREGFSVKLLNIGNIKPNPLTYPRRKVNSTAARRPLPATGTTPPHSELVYCTSSTHIGPLSAMPAPHPFAVIPQTRRLRCCRSNAGGCSIYCCRFPTALDCWIRPGTFIPACFSSGVVVPFTIDPMARSPQHVLAVLLLAAASTLSVYLSCHREPVETSLSIYDQYALTPIFAY